MIDLFISAFVTLFVVIDPPGCAPIYASLTTGASALQRRSMAIRATLIAGFILIFFAMFGEALLSFLHIDLDSFRIAGGVMLFIIAIDMVFEKRTERREQRAEKLMATPEVEDVSVFPMAMPMLAGPGSIASVMLLVSQNSGLDRALVIFGALLLVLLLTLAALLLAGPFMRLIGNKGEAVITRLLGVLLAALAAQFVMDFDAAVALIVGLRAFGRAFELRFAIAHCRHARAVYAAARQIVCDRRRAPFGQPLIIGFAALRIGVAVNVDIGARIFRQGRGDAVECAAELRLHDCAVEVESHVARHVEHKLVALSLDIDAGARCAFAQLLFLLVHIIADARAGDGADTGAQDLFGPVVASADEIAEQIAAERAANAADRGLGNALLARFGVGDATGQRERAKAGDGRELDRPLVHFWLPFLGIAGPCDATTTRITYDRAFRSVIHAERRLSMADVVAIVQHRGFGL